MEKPFEFQAGDVVDAWGYETILRYSYNAEYPFSFSLRDLEYNVTSEGKLERWHKTPTLKLIRRPKKKVKKTIERWVNMEDTGEIILHYLYTSEQQAKKDLEDKVRNLVKFTAEIEVEE